MKIEFSNHALDQIKRRKITRKMIIETISEPARYIPSYGQRTLIQGRFGAKMLEVVARIDDNKLVIITAYFLKK